MSNMRAILMAFALVAVVAFTAVADETKNQAKAEAPKKLKSQTHCPVMGGEIDSTVFTDIQGQRVYHCCPACSGKLLADPDKYFKQAAAEGVLFENIQTACPVSGEELKDKSVYVDYEGRRIALCCEKCREPFLKDPEEYLKKMDEHRQPAKGEKAERQDAHSSCGHNH